MPPITGTVELAPEVQTRYEAEYLMQGQAMLYFDPLCEVKDPVLQGRGFQTVEWPLIGSLQPTPTALNEYNDVTPQVMRAGRVNVTLHEYGNAVQLSRFLADTAYSDVHEQAAYANGYSMAETFDLIVRAIANQGSRVFYAGGRGARNQLQGKDTAGDRISVGLFDRVAMLASRFKMPHYPDNTLCCVIDPFVHRDLLQDTTLQGLAQRQAPEMMFNGEAGYWGGVRIIVSANAKGFWGQGAARAANGFASTLAAAAAVGDMNVKVTANTGLAAGEWMTIQDAGEPANTWSDTNEMVYVTEVGTVGAGGTGVDFFAIDPGPPTTANPGGGGLRFAHLSGAVINDACAVFPIAFVGPNSLVKAYSDDTGPYGESVVTGPFDILGRYVNLGWYQVGGWNRQTEPFLLRLEVGCSEC